ncbi:MAG TPA: hypothetical protein VFD38_18905 [Myxococcaceae bacterium]|nr:hypothetical protein [Myxococcaceae bacterium]
MRPRLRRSLLPFLVSLAVSGCGNEESSGNPDAGGGGNLLSVGGSYPTHAALLPGSTCADAAVQDALTTVTHSPGAMSLTLSHAGTSHSGTVDTAGNFQTTPKTVVVSPASFRLTIAGRFTVSGLEATVTVEQLAPSSCSYSVQWTATKSGSPNVIPG